ncbi:conserved exported hypothetical protein [Hyphomicrobiales bacterium]|nr:conserved exported hypothetical protein [Hyphomicrobiales bacterium]
MRSVSLLMASALLTLALGGCAYKPLKAPCSPDEGGAPLAYAQLPPAPPARAAVEAVDACGPMRPI